MHPKWLLGACLATVVALLVASVDLSGQLAGAPGRIDRSATGPRTADGHPDFQGLYDLATLTPLERPAELATAATMTAEQARRLEERVAGRRELLNRPSDANRGAPPVGGDGSAGAAGNVGGYNNFWIDNGDTYFAIEGVIRSSIIVDPPNGRLPEMLPSARARNAARLIQATSDEAENDPGLERAAGAYDDPERRPLGERCLIGFGSTSGPPALPVLYNNLHQIVQTPDTILIMNEMVHDARIVRMNARHLPPTVRRWMGDSVGRWDGDTLVVDTTNFTDKTRFRGSSDQLHVVERFSRLDARRLLYRFTVEDPSTWDRPFTGEYVWPMTDQRMFEYACHEANHSLEYILRGARQRDREKAAGAREANR
ncbi:MAG: hypothetical protein AB7N65_17925 [Vicinamibacterales bacterium]